MNKKLIFLAVLSIFCFGTKDVLCKLPRTTFYSNQTLDDPPSGLALIELKGTLSYGAGPNAIEVGVSDNAIYIYFHQNFGNVSITLFNPNGVNLYSDVINTAIQQQLIIPVTFSTEGTYTIFMENTFGNIEGEFEK